MNRIAYICLLVLVIFGFNFTLAAGFASAEVSKDKPSVSDNANTKESDVPKTEPAPSEEPKSDDKTEKADNDKNAKDADKPSDKNDDQNAGEPKPETEPEANPENANPIDDKLLTAEDSSSSSTRTKSPEHFDPEQVYLNRYLRLRTDTYTIYFPKDLREGIVSIKERQRYGLDFALENVFTINNIWGQNIYRFPADVKAAPEEFSDYWQAMIDTLLETPGSEQEGEASIYGTKDYQWRHAEFLLTITPKGDLVPLKTIKIEDKSFKMPSGKTEDKSQTQSQTKTEVNVDKKAEEQKTEPADTKSEDPKDKSKPGERILCI